MYLHIIVTPFEHESRVLKQCHVAAEFDGNKPRMVIALWEPGLEQQEVLDDGLSVWRVSLKSRSWPKNLVVQVIKYFEFAYRILARMRSSDITVITAHSVAALPVGVALKWLTNTPLIYDAHELESEANGLSQVRRVFTRRMEGLWIRAVDRVVTVCDSIADWYVKAFPIERPLVVRNVPIRVAAPETRSTILRDEHGVPADKLLFLYQGSLAPGRGIGSLLTVFARPEMRSHFVVMGYGELEAQVREAAAESPNIHFQPAVPPEKVLFYTSSADIGLCLIENTCLSYYYSLPNKLFEYLLSGLPVLVNDMPEQRRIVEEFNCGWVVPEAQAEQEALLSSIENDQFEVRRAGAIRAGESFEWAAEAAKLQALYATLAPVTRN